MRKTSQSRMTRMASLGLYFLPTEGAQDGPPCSPEHAVKHLCGFLTPPDSFPGTTHWGGCTVGAALLLVDKRADVNMQP